MIRLKRIVWKPTPPEEAMRGMDVVSAWQSWFSKTLPDGRVEWLRVQSDDPRCYAPTPEGYEPIRPRYDA